jgi:hypothetical protein
MSTVNETSLKQLAELENEMENGRKNLSQTRQKAHDLMVKEGYPAFHNFQGGKKFKLFDDYGIFGRTERKYMKLIDFVPPKEDQKVEFPYGYNAIIVEGAGVGTFVYIKAEYVIPVS